MQDIPYLLAGLFAATTLYLLLRQLRLRREPAPAQPTSTPESVQELAGRLQATYDQSAWPADLLELPEFRRGVERLRGPDFTPSDKTSANSSIKTPQSGSTQLAA